MSVQGFFGLKIVPGKTYSQVAEHSFRITMASLADTAKNNTSRASLRIKVDDNEFVLCSLTPSKMDQQLLDLIIAKNEEIVFSVDGQHTIHLTGNYLFDDEEDEDEEDEEIDSDEMDSDEAQLMLDDEDDEEDDEFDTDAILNNVPEGIDRAKVLAYLNGEIDSDEMASDSEEELDESRIQEIEEDDEEEEEEEEEPVKPLTKKEKKAAAAAAAAAKEEKPKEEKVMSKKEKKAAAVAEKEQAAKQEKKRAADSQKEEPAKKQKTEEKKPKQQEKKQVTKLANGLIIEDVKIGEGANVKSGARIGMRYIGKLTNGKVFDKNTSGKPFNFVLGRGEVIKGWDQGILGMKLGGERKLTIPAPLAYGKRGAPPQIPANATLVFEIKLVAMK